MPDFCLRGITLELPGDMLQGGVARALTGGHYEGAESAALERHLRPGDRFLDLGAGLGFLCCLAARIVGAGQVTGLEAGPPTVELARANLARNGFGAARVVHAAVTPDKAGEVAFTQAPAFWASSLAKAAEGHGAGTSPGLIRVPARAIGPLLDEIRPSVLSCDIEGAEVDVLTAGPLNPELRLIVAEIHPRHYGPEGVRRIFDALSGQGFAYSTEGSRGAVVVFERQDRPDGTASPSGADGPG